MKVQILREAGYDEAMLGITLSHGASLERAKEIAPKLALKQGGHNKFLESIMVWIDVTAPRYWWAQADTYRISTKQSESTMHTIMKRPLTQDDFARPIPDDTLKILNWMIEDKEFEYLKTLLPEGFLQRRIWLISYKTLQNIVSQRHNHRLYEWEYFCAEVVNQLEHPGFIQEVTE